MSAARATALRAESIARLAQHAPDCARDCGGTFVCRGCRRRFGECRRHFFHVARCLRCAKKARG